MPDVLVFSDVPRLAAELLTAGLRLGTRTHVVCLGPHAAGLSGLGADSVTALVPGQDRPDRPRPEDFAGPLATLAGQWKADLLLIGATVAGRELAARVATALGIGLVADATSVAALPDGGWRTERLVHAGTAVQTETWSGPAVVTIAAGRWPAAVPEPGAVRDGQDGRVTTLAVPTDDRVRVLGSQPRPGESVDLSEAVRLVCVGMGCETPDDLELARQLAGALDAELACTRPVAEDRGWLPRERYLGISGAVVHPQLYLALGVSGQVQHTMAIRDAKVVVGVDVDPTAPLAGVSDITVVGDLRQVAPALTAALRARSAADPAGADTVEASRR